MSTSRERGPEQNALCRISRGGEGKPSAGVEEEALQKGPESVSAGQVTKRGQQRVTSRGEGGVRGGGKRNKKKIWVLEQNKGWLHA